MIGVWELGGWGLLLVPGGGRIRTVHVSARLPEIPPLACAHRNTGDFPGSKPCRRLAILPALALALILLACSGNSGGNGGGDGPVATPKPAVPAAQSQATSTPAPTAPPPGDPAAELQRANALERSGFWEAAAQLRNFILVSGAAASLSPDVRATATLDQVRLLLRLDEVTEAEARLLRLDPATLPASQQAVAWLLRGRIAAALGDTAAALDAFDVYLRADGAAAGYALLQRARLLTAIDPEAALRAYAGVLSDPLRLDLYEQSALLESGVLLENAGRDEEARARYQTLADVSPWASDDAFALHRLGALALAQEDTATAMDAWLRLLREFPWDQRAGLAYDDLVGIGTAVDAPSAGRLLYRQGRSEEAEAVLSEALRADLAVEEAAVALYFLGAIAEDAGRTEEAVSSYLTAANLDPSGVLTDDALWWAARLLEERGQFNLAGILYDRLSAVAPMSEFSERAQILAALMPYLSGDLARAALRFHSLALSASGETARQTASLWEGKILDALGNPVAAAAAYSTAERINPAAYVGLRAASLLSGQPPAPNSQTAPPVAVPEASAGNAAAETRLTEAWLTERIGPEPADTDETLQAAPHWRAALDLQAAGLVTAAGAQFSAHLEEASAEPWLLYRSAQALSNLSHLRIEAAELLLQRVSGERVQAPQELLEWAYPLTYTDLAGPEPSGESLDPLLLAALIRQESRFNPDAGSVAGALGLTQVIPATGGDIAAQLGENPFDPRSLFRPEQSVRYGAFYLQQQLRAFDGALGVALAAYNGGPGNANRWAGGDPTIDPDLFYERITFAETRLYLRTVQENYAWYRFLYRDASQPALADASAAATTR